jgi:hypothetical protein
MEIIKNLYENRNNLLLWIAFVFTIITLIGVFSMLWKIALIVLFIGAIIWGVRKVLLGR